MKALVPFTRTDSKVDFPTVCQPPSEPENGGYKCHPLTCHRLTQGTVIEYFCDEGYILKGGYQFRTCDNGEWKSPMQISCHPVQGTSHSSSSLIHKLGNLHILLSCHIWIVFLLTDKLYEQRIIVHMVNYCNVGMYKLFKWVQYSVRCSSQKAAF